MVRARMVVRVRGGGGGGGGGGEGEGEVDEGEDVLGMAGDRHAACQKTGVFYPIITWMYYDGCIQWVYIMCAYECIH